MDNKIIAINLKLKDLEKRAVGASEPMKVWLRRGYRLLLEKKKRLQNSVKKVQDKLF